jgi:hypothetical protein
MSELNRRNFLKITGASIPAASLLGGSTVALADDDDHKLSDIELAILAW